MTILIAVEELDALPVLSVILDARSRSWQKRVWSWGTSKPRWLMAGSEIPSYSEDPASGPRLPVTLLWQPGES